MINGVQYIKSSSQAFRGSSSIPSPINHSIQPLNFRTSSPQFHIPTPQAQTYSLNLRQMSPVSNSQQRQFYPTIHVGLKEIPNNQMSFMPKSPVYAQLNTSFSKKQQRIPSPMPNNIQQRQFEHRNTHSNQQRMVSKSQFDRCVMQCQNWSTKYNELHLKYLNVIGNSQQRKQQSRQNIRQYNPMIKYEGKAYHQPTYQDHRNTMGYSFELQFNALKKENNKLRQQLRQHQHFKSKYQALQHNMQAIIAKCKQETLKACLYEVDKFKLNEVMNQEDD